MTAFTKGQPVTFLQNWDCKGTVRIVNLTVHSCGPKQMILVDDFGQKYQGRFFRPTEEQAGMSRVVARLDPDAATAAALAQGAAIVASERAHLERCATIDKWQSPGYVAAIARELAALHEPEAVFASASKRLYR